MPAGAILLKAIMQEIDLYEEGAEDDKEEAEMVGKQDPVRSPFLLLGYLRYILISNIPGQKRQVPIAHTATSK